MSFIIEPQFEYKDISNIDINRFSQASYLPGLDVSITSQNNCYYRFDGPVRSIRQHLIIVLQEFGFNVTNKSEFLESMAYPSAQCRQFTVTNEENQRIKFAIPFYQPTFPELDTFNVAHEDMHAIQFFEFDSVYNKLSSRLKHLGYNIDLSSISDNEL